jgi:hypothetical protein
MSRVALTILITVPFANTHASYGIRAGIAGLENAPSFDEASLSSSLDQGKHLAYTLYRFLLYNLYLMSMIVHLSIGV